jgi:hypothetical protein
MLSYSSELNIKGGHHIVWPFQSVAWGSNVLQECHLGNCLGIGDHHMGHEIIMSKRSRPLFIPFGHAPLLSPSMHRHH